MFLNVRTLLSISGMWTCWVSSGRRGGYVRGGVELSLWAMKCPWERCPVSGFSVREPGTAEEEPTDYTQSFDLGSGRALAAGPLGHGTAFNTQTMAVIGDLIFVSGVQASDVMLVYNTTADTWFELPPRPNDDPSGTGRDHATAAAGGTVFVRDGSQFWTFETLIFADGFESGSMAAWSGPDPS
jgi:hypothetical protein